jgi:hypothetical protein
MKRYLTYLVLVALSSSVFFTAQSTPEVLASTNQSSSNKISSSPSPTSTKATKIAKTTPAVTPATPSSAPAPVAAVVPAPPVFDANNPATWPHCSDNQFVRADNGQCANNPAPAPVAVVRAAPAAAYQAPASPGGGVVAGCGDHEYAHYIYSHESGCNTGALNSSGCYGIGQACPASKISYCGGDYACQNEFFTSYANSRYGGWAGAYNFWLNNHWW